MAACGSLQHIFEKPLPENSSIFDSLSPWKRIPSMNSTHHLDDNSSSSSDSSFTEIFGELHFKESPNSCNSSPLSSSAPSSVITDVSTSQFSGSIEKNPIAPNNFIPANKTRQYRHSDSFSSMNSESLSICTEGLGFESFDSDVVEESSKSADEVDNNNNPTTNFRPHHRNRHERRRTNCIKHTKTEYLPSACESKRSRISGVEFPPPISCIGRTGKPWVCFKSYRNNGRFILKEIRIPTQEFLHACREDGRLKLHFISSDDEKIDEEDEEEDDDDDDDDDNNGGFNAHADENGEDEENDEKTGESS